MHLQVAQEAVANYSIHLNLHHSCTKSVERVPFEGFRASQLLSAGAIVISEHAAPQACFAVLGLAGLRRGEGRGWGSL